MIVRHLRKRVQCMTRLHSTIPTKTPVLPFPLTMRPSLIGRDVVQELGVVVGADVRSRTILHDIFSAIFGVFGGESRLYTALVDENRDAARSRMVEQAKALGATSVVSLREIHGMTVNRIVVGLHTVSVIYGTAVRCRRVHEDDEEEQVERQLQEGGEVEIESVPVEVKKVEGKGEEEVEEVDETVAMSGAPARTILEAKMEAAMREMEPETASAAVASGVSPLSKQYAEVNRQRFRVSTRDKPHDTIVTADLGDVACAHVRSKNILKDIWTAVGGMVGGEASYATHLINEALAAAVDDAVAQAKDRGANALVKTRFEISLAQNRLIAGLHASVLCHGTAVRTESKKSTLPKPAEDQWR